MSDPVGHVTEPNEFNSVCVALSRMLSPGDVRIDYAVSMTAPVESTTVIALNPEGKYATPEGKANSPLETEELRTAVKSLRKAGYRPGLGTWFSALITVTAEGAATAKYNYDHEPDFGLGGVDPVAYVTDLEYFPRDEQHQPEWLKSKLAEGRERLAG